MDSVQTSLPTAEDEEVRRQLFAKREDGREGKKKDEGLTRPAHRRGERKEVGEALPATLPWRCAGKGTQLTRS